VTAPVGTDIARALDLLRRGGLVAIPTETVYGLAADAGNEGAVRRIFAAKGRPSDHPLIVHIAGAADVFSWASDPSPETLTLAATCWPGPLTVIVHRRQHVLDVVTGGRDTVGLRVPAHPLTLELLSRFGGGLAAPSANRFGRISPTTAAHVVADLGDLVDYILDGGPSSIGVESTIVDCTAEPVQILRHGAVTEDDLDAILLGPIDRQASGPSRAAGMMASHYAPRATVELVDSSEQARRRAAILAAGGTAVAIIDHVDNLGIYARQLYAELRAADADAVDVIVAVMPPASGLGHAIRDRLAKAAAPR
jgi:L-threonylcarbamoyladenylate synthase